MKLCRIGKKGKEKPALIDEQNNYRDLSEIIEDFNPSTLNFNILEKLKKLNINIVMTSDNTSKDVFYKVFKKYDIVNNDNLKNLNNINEILILDQLNFDNWTSIINTSAYIITPECGCTHIASLSEAKLCIIYDADNVPVMIAEEYAPWMKKYTKIFSNNRNLEKELVSFIN